MNLILKRFLEVLDHHSIGGVTEVCVGIGGHRLQVGYFDSIENAVQNIETYNGKESIYISLNPVVQACLARANNRLMPTNYRTRDHDALRDSWFFIDIDPVRPTGISSTQDELEAALETSEAVYTFLVNAGIPQESTLTAISGNGAYILIRQPDYEITPEHTEIKKRLLNYVSELFSDARVEIDCKVFNPSRLIGALGTLKMKGDSMPERPHRCSEILTVGGAKFDPTLVQRVEPFDLYALAMKLLPAPQEHQRGVKGKPSSNGSSHFDIRDHSTILEDYHETTRGWAYCRCPSHQGKSKTSLFINLDKGSYGCFKGCTTEQIREAIGFPKPTSSSKNHSNTTASQPSLTSQASSGNSDDLPVRVICLGDVQAEDVKWLWFPRIPLGKLTLLEGDPGLGKSYLAFAIAAGVAAGRGLPDSDPTAPRNVLLLSAEDGLADTIRPRLDSMHADVSRIFALDGAIAFDEAGLLQVEAAILEHEPVLVVIDPLVAYLGAGVDLYRANETRAVMKKLARLAEKYCCAIVGIRHLTKAGKDRAIYRGIGSIDLTAACRSVLLAGCDPNDPDKRAIVHIKSNLAEMGESIGYEIRGGVFYWTGISSLTSEQIFAARTSEEKRTALLDAQDFLREVLADGERPEKEIRKEAHEAGISDATLNRAKKALKIKPVKRGQPGTQGQGWFWNLPKAFQNNPEEYHEKKDDHLRPNISDKGFSDRRLVEDDHLPVHDNLRDQKETFLIEPIPESDELEVIDL